MRFQIQEMARAEKMSTDAEIETELATYNPLIPGVGEISMTLFIELTSDGALRGVAAPSCRDRTGGRLHRG